MAIGPYPQTYSRAKECNEAAWSKTPKRATEFRVKKSNKPCRMSGWHDLWIMVNQIWNLIESHKCGLVNNIPEASIWLFFCYLHTVQYNYGTEQRLQYTVYPQCQLYPVFLISTSLALSKDILTMPIVSLFH